MPEGVFAGDQRGAYASGHLVELVGESLNSLHAACVRRALASSIAPPLTAQTAACTAGLPDFGTPGARGNARARRPGRTAPTRALRPLSPADTERPKTLPSRRTRTPRRGATACPTAPKAPYNLAVEKRPGRGAKLFTRWTSRHRPLVSPWYDVRIGAQPNSGDYVAGGPVLGPGNTSTETELCSRGGDYSIGTLRCTRACL